MKNRFIDDVWLSSIGLMHAPFLAMITDQSQYATWLLWLYTGYPEGPCKFIMYRWVVTFSKSSITFMHAPMSVLVTDHLLIWTTWLHSCIQGTREDIQICNVSVCCHYLRSSIMQAPISILITGHPSILTGCRVPGTICRIMYSRSQGDRHAYIPLHYLQHEQMYIYITYRFQWRF